MSKGKAMSKIIDTYDVLNINQVLEKLENKLTLKSFMIFLQNSNDECPILYNFLDKKDFIKSIMKKIEDNGGNAYLLIQELTQEESERKNDFTTNSFLLYKKVSMILIERNVAYLLRKEDVKKSITEDDLSDIIFEDAISLINE